MITPAEDETEAPRTSHGAAGQRLGMAPIGRWGLTSNRKGAAQHRGMLRRGFVACCAQQTSTRMHPGRVNRVQAEEEEGVR